MCLLNGVRSRTIHQVTVEELLWDMDGTLLDTTAVVPAAFVRAVHALNGPHVTAAEVIKSYWRGPPEVILEHLVGRRLVDRF